MRIENIITTIQYTGYFHSEIRKMLDAGKVAPENEEVRIQRILEEQRKKVHPVYEIKEKLVNILI
jgi:DNA-binding transcriptional MerR regulator